MIFLQIIFPALKYGFFWVVVSRKRFKTEKGIFPSCAKYEEKIKIL